MEALYPLRFRPLFRRYIWGGRRLKTLLDKPIGPGDDWAESWEICDHGPDQCIIEYGPLAGVSLGRLTAERGHELLGRHHPRQPFPLLLKFLDARDTLSVQVHPDDALAARLDPPMLGKTEALVVLHAEPGSLLYAGLKPGVDHDRLAAAIRTGQCQDCLHSFVPVPGDCLLVPAGAVHAYGAGLLLAELQQASDVTYRLFDWDRIGADGRPRPLHVEAGLAAVDYDLGPLVPQVSRRTARPQVCRLVECDQFVWDRWEFDEPLAVGGDGACHIIAVLEGSVEIDGDPSGAPLSHGCTALLPACLGPVQLRPQAASILLDAYLPAGIR